ncbi:MAG: hypothetical protein NVS9B5_34340 [Terriglobales bacterium]
MEQYVGLDASQKKQLSVSWMAKASACGRARVARLRMQWQFVAFAAISEDVMK